MRHALPTDISTIKNPDLAAAVAEIQRQSKAQGHRMAPRQMESAPERNPEPPRPLMREIPPADPFPIDALGDVLAPAARAIHDRVQAPLAMCGQSVLAAAALSVQAHADVRLPTGKARPLTNFFASVAETGERKSAVDEEALWAVRKREDALREKYGAERLAFENDKAAWEKAREAAVKDKSVKGDRARIKAALDKIGPPPIPPLEPVLLVGEPTYEGLCKLLALSCPSVGIFSDEGGQFIGGHGMTEEAKLRTAAGLSHLWDGRPIKRVRHRWRHTAWPARGDAPDGSAGRDDNHARRPAAGRARAAVSVSGNGTRCSRRHTHVARVNARQRYGIEALRRAPAAHSRSPVTALRGHSQ